MGWMYHIFLAQCSRFAILLNHFFLNYQVVDFKPSINIDLGGLAWSWNWLEVTLQVLWHDSLLCKAFFYRPVRSKCLKDSWLWSLIRSSPCVFLGYSSSHHGYRCLNLESHRIYVSHHVRFHETVFPFEKFEQVTSSLVPPHHLPIFHPWTLLHVFRLLLPNLLFQKIQFCPLPHPTKPSL
jgi:hypothetical protein